MNQQPVANGMPTYFILLIGQMISVLGSELSGFAIGVWVYQQTSSVTLFTLTLLFGAIPRLFMAPIAGALVDRWDRRWVLIISNILLALNTLALAALFFSGQLAPWHIYVLAVTGTIFGCFPAPARAAITPLIVPKDQLGRAAGLGQLGTAMVQILAPALAGVLMVTAGLGLVVLVDAFSFLFVLLSLLIVRIPQPPASAGSSAARGSLLGEIGYGWSYLVARPGLMALLVLLSVSSFLLATVFVLINPLLLSIGSPAVLGTVASIGGFGTLVGGVLIAIWGGPKRRINGVLGAMFLGSLCVMVGGSRPSIPLFAAAAFVFLCMTQISGACMTLIWQTKVAPDVQGRVFALSGMIIGIAQPLSFLIAGALADRVFEPLMAEGGALAGSVGQIIGVGPGRGIGLMFIIMGFLHLLVTIAGYLYPRLRLVEDEVPNAIGPTTPEEQPVSVSPASA